MLHSSSANPLHRVSLALAVGLASLVATGAAAQTEGDSEAAASATTPKAVVAENLIDLGEVPRSDTATARFTIENQGGAPLVFDSISSNCACLEVSADSIPANSTGVVAATIDTLKLSGPSEARILLTTNDPDNPRIQLEVRVFSKNVLTAEPGYYRYLVHRNFTGAGTIRQVVVATDNQEFEITRLESPSPFLRLGDPEPAAEEERMARFTGPQWAFEAQLDNRAPVGALTGNVLVHTSHPEQKILPLPLSGFVRPVVAFTPETLEKTFTPREGGYLQIHFKQFAADPMTIEEITSDLEGFTFEPVEIEAGREWNIRIFPDPALPKGPFAGTVTVRTSSIYAPEASFAFSGVVE